ncbi:hypothetical protein [Streptomyces sp. UNOB3_S3]|uniref:vWA domain-containing protein n=1 Tax=Streptomyces sp. UNOB3_S3 TaxID=2871682 RepID=UPI001E3F29AA|nr:hypothetical protein [Streptomyces sp. UNOB3_S3]MCC3779373.1 hypothetical protein [Streptomyces sp. UNOB3_S3]
MSDVRGQLLPVYVLADESGSMAPHMDDLNAGLDSLHQALLGEPMVASKVRFSVIGFSDDVSERLPLVDLRFVEAIPRLTASYTTSYQAAFTDLLTRIPRDVQALKGQQYQVHRPAVFFLSDGQPNDEEDWLTPHARLTDRTVTRAAPNIIACGIGEAEPGTILKVATRQEFAYVSIPGANVGDSIAKFCSELTKSIVSSVPTLDTQQPQLTVNPPQGFTLAIDVV